MPIKGKGNIPAQRARARARKEAAKIAAAAAPTPTVEELAKVPLITDPAELARLAPDAAMRQLLLRATIDKTQAEFNEAEKKANEIALAAGDLRGAHLPRPEILRRPNEKAAQILLNQLAHVQAQAGTTAFVAANPTRANLAKHVPIEEVEQMRETLASIPEKRDKAASDAREREAKKTHVNGDTIWLCENYDSQGNTCGQFRGASLEVVRKKAAAEPGWQWVCPRCRGLRVRLADVQDVAAA